MSDCSTNAMKPKEPPKTCGTCANHERFGECAERGYCELDMVDISGTIPLRLASDIACRKWKTVPPTLEQRFQQLEQVARDMLREIKTMAGSTCYTSDLDYEHKHEWVEDCVSPWREKLEQCGVSVDG